MSERDRLITIHNYISKAWKEIKNLHEKGITEKEFDAYYEEINKQFFLDVPEELKESIKHLAHMIMQEAGNMLKSE